MARSSRSPARIVIALSIAGVLAIFLVYTALTGTTPALQPSNLAGHAGQVSLTGKVIGKVAGNASTPKGLRFSIQDINNSKNTSPTIPIVYRGPVPDLFKTGRDINLTGQLSGASFVATQMTTKCPSKYTASPTA